MAEGTADATSAEAALDIHKQIAEVFDRFDEDGDGMMDREELATLMRKANSEAWNDERLDILLSQLDTNKDGRVDFEEFLSWVFSDKVGHVTLQGALNDPGEPPDSRAAPYDGPRWMLHDRRSSEYPRTALRLHPSPVKDYKQHSAMNGEIVEVLGIKDKYLDVRLCLSRVTGWLHERHLHPCSEGAAEAVRDEVQRVALKPSDGRLKEVRKFLRRRNTTRKGGDIRASRVWFLKGHHLGQVGLSGGGPKETFFFGCQNSLVESIASNGFGDIFGSLKGDFGKGAHLSPQSCKAYNNCESYMFICEAALGNEADRLTLTAPWQELDREEVFKVKGKLSAQVRAGDRFEHEERIVYDPGQVKPVYLLELEHSGLHSLHNTDSPYKDLLK